MILYINGISEAKQKHGIANLRTKSEELLLGMQGITPAYFSGEVDEVRVWNNVPYPGRKTTKYVAVK